VEQEENQGKQLSMIPWPFLTWLDLVISMGYICICYIFIYCIVDPNYMLCPSLLLLSCPCHV
jgi:hypothetical protein